MRGNIPSGGNMTTKEELVRQKADPRRMVGPAVSLQAVDLTYQKPTKKSSEMGPVLFYLIFSIKSSILPVC